MARSDSPWIVGLATSLPVRRKRETPGSARRASSRRGLRARSSGPTRTMEKARSAGLGARRGAVTWTSETIGGGMSGIGVSSGWTTGQNKVTGRGLYHFVTGYRPILGY